MERSLKRVEKKGRFLKRGIQPKAEEDEKMFQQSPFPVISIAGEPYNRGYQYGSLCKNLIEETSKFYRKIFKHRSNLDWNQSLQEGKKFIPVIEGYDSEIMEEIRGVAEGSGRPLEEIVLLNVRSEIAFSLVAKGGSSAGCTTLVATPDATSSKHMLIGQNWDWHPDAQALNVILKIKQKGRPHIVQIVEAGIIGKIGFNSAGIALVANALISDKWNLGVPFQVILRGILNAECMADAILAISKAKRGSAGNFLIAHTDGEVIDIEAAPQDVNFIFPDNGILAHSNHFTVSNPKINDFGPSIFPSTIFRRHRANKLLTMEKGDINAESLKRVLKDHFDKPYSICWHIDTRLPESDQIQTDVSLIIDLTQKTMEIAQGPPCGHEYIPFTFEDLFQ